jgi:hypothetical protein
MSRILFRAALVALSDAMKLTIWVRNDGRRP